MREREAELRRLDVQVVIVTFENDVLARNYVADTALAWPLLVDATREAYRGYGMLTASIWDVWGPKTWWAYLKELAKGAALKTSEGDVSQRGGDVLIDPAGTVRVHHVGAGPADRPSVESLLELVTAHS